MPVLRGFRQLTCLISKALKRVYLMTVLTRNTAICTMLQRLLMIRAGLQTISCFQIEWFSSIKELIDNYHPDLLYSDSQMPFEDVGRSLVAHYYNQDMTANNGALNVVYTCKQQSKGKWVQDVERGSLDSLCPYPWQTDTSIGDWYYRTGQKYRLAPKLFRCLLNIEQKWYSLADVVQTPEGNP